MVFYRVPNQTVKGSENLKLQERAAIVEQIKKERNGCFPLFSDYRLFTF